MINFENLEKINKKIIKIDVKGKPYAMVNERVKAFRELCPKGTISSEIIKLDDGICVIKASVFDDEGKLLATGYAYEKENSTFINKTSFIENADTSAIGRALGFAGIGIDESIASYEEVANAITNQNKKVEKSKTPTFRNQFILFAKEHNLDFEELSIKYDLSKKSTELDFRKALEAESKELESSRKNSKESSKKQTFDEIAKIAEGL